MLLVFRREILKLRAEKKRYMLVTQLKSIAEHLFGQIHPDKDLFRKILRYLQSSSDIIYSV